mmetsp:Transcript_2833/g.6114  ORF Transcript_2833/g.6114 Transcript_2833/m.6114 type:complete len:227 (-) Transcript_2833:45-725(-)
MLRTPEKYRQEKIAVGGRDTEGRASSKHDPMDYPQMIVQRAASAATREPNGSKSWTGAPKKRTPYHSLAEGWSYVAGWNHHVVHRDDESRRLEIPDVNQSDCRLGNSLRELQEGCHTRRWRTIVHSVEMGLLLRLRLRVRGVRLRRENDMAGKQVPNNNIVCKGNLVQCLTLQARYTQPVTISIGECYIDGIVPDRRNSSKRPRKCRERFLHGRSQHMRPNTASSS